MIALSIQQPWAWLIVNGHKDIENRTWPTKMRGVIIVHAGKTFDQEGYDWIRATFPQIPMPYAKALERGGIIGQVRITGCVTESKSPWFFGPFGFVLTDGQPRPFKACKGKLGFFQIEL